MPYRGGLVLKPRIRNEGFGAILIGKINLWPRKLPNSTGLEAEQYVSVLGVFGCVKCKGKT